MFNSNPLYCNYALPVDFVGRIGSRKPYWFHGNPTIKLNGEERRFGEILFDFGDEVVKYGMYIRSRELILNSAHIAIQNFTQIARELMTFQ